MSAVLFAQSGKKRYPPARIKPPISPASKFYWFFESGEEAWMTYITQNYPIHKGPVNQGGHLTKHL
jgi:hypothetical protein